MPRGMKATPAASEAERRERIVAFCSALPEASHRDGEHIKFEVRGMTFAYYLRNHHGNGRIALNVKTAAGGQDLLLRIDPARFFLPAYLGAKGWIGVRIDLPRIDWGEVEALILDSYRLVAPKRLADLTRSIV
jgi:hypothetical protein